MNKKMMTLFEKMQEKYDRAYIESYLGNNEPGYDDKPSLLGNWNYVSEKDQTRLEKVGWVLEWSDEWISCSSCGKIFRQSPNSYHWEMAGIIDYENSECCCIECAVDYIEDHYMKLENDSKKAVLWPIAEKYPPENYGYKLVKEGFENGWYEGQNDEPVTILNSLLQKNPQGHYLFVIVAQGQFDIEFSVYERIQNDQE